jgi:hypothetical protein
MSLPSMGVHSAPAVTELADLSVVADNPPPAVDGYLDNLGLFWRS